MSPCEVRINLSFKKRGKCSFSLGFETWSPRKLKASVLPMSYPDPIKGCFIRPLLYVIGDILCKSFTDFIRKSKLHIFSESKFDVIISRQTSQVLVGCPTLVITKTNIPNKKGPNFTVLSCPNWVD